MPQTSCAVVVGLKERGGALIYKLDFKRGFVYLMVSNTKGWYKIGTTKNSPSRRLFEFIEAAPDLDIELLAVIPSDDCERLEKNFHANFRDKRLDGEKWQELDLERNKRSLIGSSEWFALNDAQVALFLAIAETTGETKRTPWSNSGPVITSGGSSGSRSKKTPYNDTFTTWRRKRTRRSRSCGKRTVRYEIETNLSRQRTGFYEMR